jgi:hypothetical protein
MLGWVNSDNEIGPPDLVPGKIGGNTYLVIFGDKNGCFL